MDMILTNIGEELASNGFLTGVFPKVTRVSFGDGNGNMVIPDKTMTSLVHQIQNGVGTVLARLANPNRLYIYTQIPATIGGITIREVGLFTEDNTLIAIGGNFEKIKPPVNESTEKFDFYITVPISSAQDITVEFSNDNLYASQEAIDVIAMQEEANRLNIATNMSRGMILMWSGSISSIPTGWALCNGLNGTPDLRDRFIIGASMDDNGTSNTSITGSNTKTGGSKDAIAVSHTHTQAAHSHTQAAHTHGDQGHAHSAWTDGQGNHAHTTQGHVSDNKFLYSGGGGVNGTGIPYSADAWTSESGHHAHNVGIGAGYANLASATPVINGTTPTINSAGSSGANANLPPYLALAFIMKL